MATDSQRVSYAEGQRITAADLEAEQSYLLGLDARHNLYEHVPGVALGLIPASDVTGAATVAAGVAIDPQGRELLSASDVPNPADPAATCVDLWIVYCLVPVRVRQPGRYDCSPGAFQRWREFGQIAASVSDAASAPVPPYDGAVYLGRIDCKASPDVDYVALIGQNVADPGARTLMQVGPAGGRDRNGFLVSATNSFGVSTPRLAIDRLGQNTFWGDVNLLAYRASVLLPSPAAGFLVLAESKTPGTAGEQISARLTPLPGGAMGLAFLAGGKTIGALPPLVGDSNDIRKLLDDFNNTSSPVSLSLVSDDPDQDQDQDLQSSAGPLLTPQDMPLTATGGGLELRKWLEPAVPPSTQIRGCSAQTAQDPTSQEPNGISFTPPAKPRTGTPLPGASAATVQVNGNSVVQFRLDLGKKKDNDPFTRLAIGAPGSGGDFSAWLTADGTGNMALIGGGTAATPSISLNATGRISQGPIQADPTDPRFTSLLVLAWLHGLESALPASTSVALTISQMPGVIETAQPWQYQVTAKNNGGGAIVLNKLLELRTIAGQTLSKVTLGFVAAIFPGASQTFTFGHQAGDMGTTGNLSLEVHLSGESGSFAWWNKVTAGPIPVVPSPTLDLSGLPTSAPPGAPFDYTFTITNTASVAIHLDSVTVTEGNGPATQLPIGVAGLQQGDQGQFTVNHPAGINADLPVKIQIAFTWANGPASSVSGSKTIASLKDLDVQVQAITHPIDVNQPWTYSLLLTNTGNQPLTIAPPDGLQQRLTNAAFTTPYANIPLAHPITLNAGQNHTEANIAATQVPQAAAAITLEIQPKYQREGRPWIPQTKTEDINLP